MIYLLITLVHYYYTIWAWCTWHCYFFDLFMSVLEFFAISFPVYSQKSAMPAVSIFIFAHQLVVPFWLTAFFCVYLVIPVHLSTCTVAKCPTVLITPSLCHDFDISTNYCYKNIKSNNNWSWGCLILGWHFSDANKMLRIQTWSRWVLFIGHRFLPLISFRKAIAVLFFVNF